MPQPPFTIVQYARLPILPFKFVQGDGVTPLDLTGYTVTVTITAIGAIVPTQDHAACVINTPPTLGTGYYAWQAGDTAIPGRYSYELTATNAGIGLGMPTEIVGFITIRASLG